jgi:predicted phage tail protein
MRKLLGLLVVSVLVLSGAGAWAAEIEGKVSSVDRAGRTIVLDNGTTLSVVDDVLIDSLREGSEVKVSYEERDGKNVATSIEVK